MSDYLTAIELAELIGCKPNQRAMMAAWLVKNHWPFVADRHGLPKVARAYRDQQLGIQQQTPPVTFDAMPNLDAFLSRHSDEDDTHTGIKRLYKRVGVRKVSFLFKHADGRTEILATARVGNAPAIAHAALLAKQKAIDIQAGHVVVALVSDLIERFRTEVDPSHYLDQSKVGKAVRNATYAKLDRFFGHMTPASLKIIHGYNYLDARSKAGAPIGANKDMALMSTICKYAVRWGVIEQNPFVGLMQNIGDRQVRVVDRSHVVRFYLWSLRQGRAYRTMGAAAMFCYLTGFRAAEVRPFRVDGLLDNGVTVLSAKRKRGEDRSWKLRHWSTRLRVVVARAKQVSEPDCAYLFPNRAGHPYTKGGWAATWQDAMYAWIGERDKSIAAEAADKKLREGVCRQGVNAGVQTRRLVAHADYFSMLDIRPAAISAKLRQHALDAYDFAAHANPSTTRKYYDKRRVREASPTE